MVAAVQGGTEQVVQWRAHKWEWMVSHPRTVKQLIKPEFDGEVRKLPCASADDGARCELWAGHGRADTERKLG